MDGSDRAHRLGSHMARTVRHRRLPVAHQLQFGKRDQRLTGVRILVRDGRWYPAVVRVTYTRMRFALPISCLALAARLLSSTPALATTPIAPAIQNVSATAITDSDATLEAQIDPESSATEYEVVLADPCRAPMTCVREVTLASGNIPATTAHSHRALCRSAFSRPDLPMTPPASTWKEKEGSSCNRERRITIG
jgi:hypothetical protein